MTQKTNQSFSLSQLFVFYWAIFWLMNGLDKFLNRLDMGFFRWHGKDRGEQFNGYFQNTALPAEWIDSLLYLVGVWELAIFIPLAITLWMQIVHSKFNEVQFKIGMFLGGATFVGFAFFDVIFGDRAELLEHSTFLVLIGVTYFLVLNEHDNKRHLSTANQANFISK